MRDGSSGSLLDDPLCPQLGRRRTSGGRRVQLPEARRASRPEFCRSEQKPGEPGFEIKAGPKGLEALVLEFPKNNDEHAQ